MPSAVFSTVTVSSSVEVLSVDVVSTVEVAELFPSVLVGEVLSGELLLQPAPVRASTPKIAKIAEAFFISNIKSKSAITIMYLGFFGNILAALTA